MSANDGVDKVTELVQEGQHLVVFQQAAGEVAQQHSLWKCPAN